MVRRLRVRLVVSALLALGLLVPFGTAALAAPPAGALERVIVVLRDGTGSPGAIADEVSRRYNGRPGFVYEHALQGFAAELPAQALAGLARDPRVDFIERDQPLALFSGPQVVPTGVNRIEADKQPVAKIDGVDERVDADIAILDQGIALHPDLNIKGGVNCTTSYLSSKCTSGNYNDVGGHGTHVAGTAAALDNGIGVVGVAPGARLWAVKIFNDSGSSWMSWTVAGIDWVASRAGTADAIEVANMSFGCACASSSRDRALSNAAGKGVVLVAAAGNDGVDVQGIAPANHPKVIAVAAIRDLDGKARGLGGWGLPAPECTSASQDDAFPDWSNYGALIALAAPGVCIYSTLPGGAAGTDGAYGYMTGTSQASPHVAGAAALYIAQYRPPANSTRWATVKDALRSPGWSVAPDDPEPTRCGFATIAGRASGRLLMLAPCD